MHIGNYYRDVILFIYFSNNVGNGRNCSALLNFMQGFHTCVGSGGERQTPDWYKEKGIEVFFTLKPLFLHYNVLIKFGWKKKNVCLTVIYDCESLEDTHLI